ncbi:hypothetical protein B0T17DRAFT_512549 [Bombardia bombarda]|uniref:Uncharacterized protein n=1 Tax=Bombardia bombarda TaxID=252184 RepID=A0AA39W3U3_9PEZI|nr:hypothetical protein B0T17DRAFT_512549 [Bombardia bombarda]
MAHGQTKYASSANSLLCNGISNSRRSIAIKKEIGSSSQIGGDIEVVVCTFEVLIVSSSGSLKGPQGTGQRGPRRNCRSVAGQQGKRGQDESVRYGSPMGPTAGQRRKLPLRRSRGYLDVAGGHGGDDDDVPTMAVSRVDRSVVARDADQCAGLACTLGEEVGVLAPVAGNRSRWKLDRVTDNLGEKFANSHEGPKQEKMQAIREVKKKKNFLESLTAISLIGTWQH